MKPYYNNAWDQGCQKVIPRLAASTSMAPGTLLEKQTPGPYSRPLNHESSVLPAVLNKPSRWVWHKLHCLRLSEAFKIYKLLRHIAVSLHFVITSSSQPSRDELLQLFEEEIVLYKGNLFKRLLLLNVRARPDHGVSSSTFIPLHPLPWVARLLNGGSPAPSDCLDWAIQVEPLMANHHESNF